jgi:hypothetical protein
MIQIATRRPLVLLRCCVAFVGAIGCADQVAAPEPAGSTSDAIVNGIPITDPTLVEATRVVHIRVTDPSTLTVENGSGSLLSNDWVLTAGHVVHPVCAACSVALTLGDFNQGHPTRFADRILYHPRFRPFLYPTDTDIALVHVSSPFVLDGKTTGHSRPISDRSTATLIGEVTTCYGYGASVLGPPYNSGPPLRFASFFVRPYPPPPPYTSWPPVSYAFSVMKSGGLVHNDLGNGQILYPGDSGGPCIDPNDPFLGQEEIWGVNQSVEDRTVSNLLDPRFGAIVAASAFRDYARSVLSAAAPPIQMDIDFDGLLDTFFIREIGGFLWVEVQLGSGAVFNLPPTGIPLLTIGDNRALVQTGDFNDDGIDDLFGYINGAAVNFHGASGFDPLTAPATSLSLLQTYEYFTPGDFNDDGVTDMLAVNSDAREDLYLGETGVGLTVPAQLAPRGFNLYGPDAFGDDESFVISAPGAFNPPPAFFFPETFGVAYLLTNVGSGLEVNPLTLTGLKDLLPTTPDSAPGDLFGHRLAWGNFDGNTNGRHALIISAPGRSVSGLHQAGMITYLAYDPSNTTTYAKVVHLDRTVLVGDPQAGEMLGSVLAAGDFDGDGLDDLAVGARGSVLVLSGTASTGLSTASAQVELSYSDLGLTTPPNTTPSSLSAMTAGDFNCDGFEDLAVGHSTEAAGGVDGAGAVIVLYGSATGLSKDTRQRIDESVSGVASDPKFGEIFGLELAAGNFNGDLQQGRPCIDLAVTALDEGGFSAGVGAVHVFYGGRSGLTVEGSQHLMQGGTAGGVVISGTAAPGDVFGGSLAITRATLDGFDDLIIGAFNDEKATGSAHALRGSLEGITASGQAYWRQGQSEIGETPEAPNVHALAPGDQFGMAVGGTSNGVVVLGARYESFPGPNPGDPDIQRAGWAAVGRLTDAVPIAIKPTAFQATEGSLNGDANYLKAEAFFGSAVTRARPGFVAVKQAPPRYAGALTLAAASGPGRVFSSCANDTKPPVFLATAVVPDCLWPPNNKLAAYSLGTEIKVSVADNCDAKPSVAIVAVTSDEPAPNATSFGPTTACVRAQRDGTGDGRAYTIVLAATDAAGNQSQTAISVEVPRLKTKTCPVAPPELFRDAANRCATER